LHLHVIDEFDETPERGLEIEPDPPRPKVERFRRRLAPETISSAVSDGPDANSRSVS
jgi:hypothetical protein